MFVRVKNRCRPRQLARRVLERCTVCMGQQRTNRYNLARITICAWKHADLLFFDVSWTCCSISRDSREPFQNSQTGRHQSSHEPPWGRDDSHRGTLQPRLFRFEKASRPASPRSIGCFHQRPRRHCNGSPVFLLVSGTAANGHKNRRAISADVFHVGRPNKERTRLRPSNHGIESRLSFPCRHGMDKKQHVAALFVEAIVRSPTRLVRIPLATRAE